MDFFENGGLERVSRAQGGTDRTSRGVLDTSGLDIDRILNRREFF